MKKTLAILLSVLLLATMPAVVGAVNLSNGDFLYRIEDNAVIIVNYVGDDTDVTIPAAIDGYPVTAIDEYAFSYCDIETVTIPATVTAIGDSAFSGCGDLVVVGLSDGLETIGEEAFYECESLTSIVIPNTVTAIGSSAFESCYALETVTLSSALTVIESYTFYDCDALTAVYYAGGEEQAAAVTVNKKNTSLTEAEWYYANTVVVGGFTSVSEDVSGLAFRFDVAATGAQVAFATVYAEDSAAVVPYTDDVAYALVRMGAVVSNQSDAVLDRGHADGVRVLDIPAVYLCALKDAELSYAVRIIRIPEEERDTVLFARPYYVYEKDGQEIVVYGDTQTQSYNGTL